MERCSNLARPRLGLLGLDNLPQSESARAIASKSNVVGLLVGKKTACIEELNSKRNINYYQKI
jgi:hypothetical protein